jgi:histidinol-phosphate aminotransferase
MASISHIALSEQLKEYIPGKSIDEIAKQFGLAPTEIIKLGSNENPWGPSVRATEALKEYLNAPRSFANDLSLYPDALGQNLAEAIKQTFTELGEADLVVGNGMDNILEGLGRLLLGPGDKVVIHTPTFEYYELITRWAHAEPTFISCKPNNNFKLDVQAFSEAIVPGVKMAFLCSPNNPTGNCLSWTEIKTILVKAQTCGTMVFLDEAYIEFAAESHLSQVQNFDNLIIGRTFSKIYGLAALRIGWAALPKGLLKAYRKVQTPFSVNSLGLLAAINALNDKQFIQQTITNNAAEREFITTNLEKLGFKVFMSQANFVAFLAGERFGCDAKNLTQALLKKGIILRNASFFRGAPPDLIRATVGLPEQNFKLIQSLQELVN